MTSLHLLAALLLLPAARPAPSPAAVFARGEAVSLERALPANERGILCLAVGAEGRIYGGTTGRAAHLFVCDPARGSVRSLARLPGGVGCAYALLRLPDGSLLAGTQADPTGIAVRTDPQAVGHLLRFTPGGDGPARVEDLGVPVPGQGVYTLAFLPGSNEVIGNTWPDGHFFSYHLTKKTFKDHGALAGYRTFETPRHAEDVNRGSGQHVRYPRQVSRAIVVGADGAAYTGGADGFLHRYDPATGRVEKQTVRLPAVAGRETWASLDAAVLLPARGDRPAAILGGTSDGYLFTLRGDAKKPVLRSLGKPLAQGGIQGLVVENGGPSPVVYGVGGTAEGMPRSFRLDLDPETGELRPGIIPHVEGQPSMVGFGALVSDGRGNLYAGERDRIGRLVRYSLHPAAAAKPARRPARRAAAPPAPADPLPRLPCRVVFAPAGTTTDGSGYTAIEVGKDGKVYVGAARYGDYAWLLRFDPAARPLFMDKVVSMQQLTGERRTGINTQGKIHAKIVVGADGRVWFASKQAHEVFDTRPEYGAAPDGYPGGHLCWYDPRTGFGRSLGILKKQEGLMGGVIDDARHKLYLRSEPKNHFLVYDLATGEVRDRGHVGAACRYMTMDRRGAVYTVGRGNTLCRYDPVTDYVEDLAVRVEGPGDYESPYVLAMGPNGKLYAAGIAHPWLLEFDVDRVAAGPGEVVVRNVAPAAPPGYPVRDVHAGTFGKDGRFYYPLNTSGPIAPGGKSEDRLFLMRFDPATKKSELVGVPEVVGLDEDKVRHTYTRTAKYRLDYMQGAAVSADGSLFLLDIYPQLNVACFPKLTAPK